MDDDRPSMKMQHVKILVHSNGLPGWHQGTWGRGDTLAEALKIARNPKYYRAYIATYDTVVNSVGALEFPDGYPPREIHNVLPKQK